MPIPTRFPGGLNNVSATDPMAALGIIDPTKWHVYFDDFDIWSPTNAEGYWIITEFEAGSGDATYVSTDENGGVLAITTDNASGDNVFIQKVGESFLLAAGKKAFFKTRVKVGSNASSISWVIGLQITDTTPLSVSDGIYWLKSSGNLNADLICRKNSTTGSTSGTGLSTSVVDTWYELAWYWDGVSEVHSYADGVKVATLTGILDSSGASTYLPDTELTISIGVQTGAAATRTFSIDYIFAAVER